MWHKTQFNKLKTQNKTSAVSILYLVTQKTLDVPKKNNIQEKLVEPVYKKNASFLLNKLVESFYKLL